MGARFYPAAALAVLATSPALQLQATSPVPEAGLCWRNSVLLLAHPVHTTTNQHSSQSATGQQPPTSEALGGKKKNKITPHKLWSSNRCRARMENFRIISKRYAITLLTSSVLFLISRDCQPSRLKNVTKKVPEVLLLGVSETLIHC